jgi:hypothetical protein
MYISAEKIAKKFIELFANNQITQNQWKFDIADHITDENMAIVATAKNFADGLQYSLDRRGIDVPEEYVVASREYQERITNHNGTRIVR